MQIFLKILQSIDVIPLSKNIYDQASNIYATLHKKGTPTGEFDLLIAATAIENNLKLVTNNTKHYKNISIFFELEADNWIL